jgi:hypothetical protein
LKKAEYLYKIVKYMKLKKKEISEIIDDNGNLIGDDDLPKNGSNNV